MQRKFIAAIGLGALFFWGCSASSDEDSPTPESTAAATATATAASTSTPPALPTSTASATPDAPSPSPHTPQPTIPGPTGTPTAFTPPPSPSPLAPSPSPTPPAPTATTSLLCPSPTPALTAGEPYGLTRREANRTCHISRFEEPQSQWRLEPAFPHLSFTEPVFVTHAGDGTGRLYVLERAGVITTFPNDPQTSTAQVFLDLTEDVNLLQREMGLLGLAFHPEHATNGEFFVHYTVGDPYRILISRFTRDPEQPDRALRSSEEVIMTIPLEHFAHNGGTLAFGPDGYLYISVGDGGGQNDLHHNGQNPFTVQGAILRIDVDNPIAGLTYAIPPDNPFADGTGGAPPIFAYGFRNPWRMSFDPQGQLWVGDVGQYTWEEVDKVTLGGNYGWPVMEGFSCWRPQTGCNTDDKLLPIAAHHHDVGQSVTGGYVYRGETLPELQGAYIYGDFGGGQVWALTENEGQAPTIDMLVDSELPIASFGETEDGELLIVDYTGHLMQLARAPSTQPEGPFPQLLSETGCFSDVARRVPASGVLPYEVASPLWSDGADKARWMALPSCDSTVTFQEEGGWGFPDGTVLFKDFAVIEPEDDDDEDDEDKGDGQRRLLETRMLVKLGGAWRGYTYRWNDAQTDAALMSEGATETVTAFDPTGELKTWAHTYPSRDACQRCHTAAAGHALGLSTGQLNLSVDYGHTVDNQLEALDHIGVFSTPIPPPDALTAYVDPSDDHADLPLRARSYLAANCAHCHMPGTNIRATFDLRFETPLSQTGACNTLPRIDDLGVEGARIIAPGDAARSVLSLRMHTQGEDRMPPLATEVIDTVGIDVVDRWIASLDDCQGP